MQLKDRNGFSLVELMTVIGVIGIMASIAIPSFLNWLPNMRLKAAARDLYASVVKAKGEAVKRNKNCALTFNQLIGATTFAYIAYEDANTNFQYDAGENILVQVQQWPKDVLLDTAQGGGDGLTFSNDNAGYPSIVFKPNTIPTASAGGVGVGNGSAFFINSNGRMVSVVVSPAGNVSIN